MQIISVCGCYALGSVENGKCDVITGQCVCRPHVSGQKCTTCQVNIFARIVLFSELFYFVQRKAITISHPGKVANRANVILKDQKVLYASNKLVNVDVRLV